MCVTQEMEREKREEEKTENFFDRMHNRSLARFEGMTISVEMVNKKYIKSKTKQTWLMTLRVESKADPIRMKNDQ